MDDEFPRDSISSLQGRRVDTIRLHAIVFAVVATITQIGCSQDPPAPSNRPQTQQTESARPVAFTSPNKNVAPDVKYVGDAACADCHWQLTQSYRRHPMGRSLAPIASADMVEESSSDANNPFVHLGTKYKVHAEDQTMTHSLTPLDGDGKSVIEVARKIDYVVGSGRRGRSYLTNRDGRLFISPITWYPQQGKWDLSPGYETNNFGFHRPVTQGCLYCHSNQSNLVADTKNHYQQPVFTGHAIGCERCHGPGELHVHGHSEGAAPEELELTIVNPRKLDPELRDSVCQQCHLSGAARVPTRGHSLHDYRPGLPLSHFIATFVLRDDAASEQDFVGQVEQMHGSKCFQQSNGALGCISCHDPHVLPEPEHRVEYFRNRCFSCHDEQSCDMPVAERVHMHGEDHCIACHMPAQETSVRHAATSDHRILRDPTITANVKSSGKVSASASALPIVAFPPTRYSRSKSDESRDLAIALLFTSKQHPGTVSRDHFHRVRPLLQASHAAHSDDIEAREALAEIALNLGDPRTALAHFQRVISQHPNREHSLVLTGHILNRVGAWQQAIDIWKRVIDLNSHLPRYWLDMGTAYAQAGRWRDCRSLTRTAVERFPLHFGLRQLLIASHHNLGDATAAAREFEALKSLNPPALPQLQAWFESMRAEARSRQ